jgi:hypothetical protein
MVLDLATLVPSHTLPQPLLARFHYQGIKSVRTHVF